MYPEEDCWVHRIGAEFSRHCQIAFQTSCTNLFVHQYSVCSLFSHILAYVKLSDFNIFAHLMDEKQHLI